MKGEGDISKIAEANIFITGDNNWESFEQWPPANKKDITMYLQPNGKLESTKPDTENNFSDYVSDPAKPVSYEENVHFRRTRSYMVNDQRFAARRPDVLVFSTDVLTEDLTVTGSIIADLMTSISTTDADFVVKIIDLFPDDFSYKSSDTKSKYPMGGYQMLVRGEVFRGRYRNSFQNPTAFIPEKIENVKFELPSIAHNFKKGHRLMIQIQSSWYWLTS